MSQLKKLLSHKTLFLYTILSYIDKLIVFATPIFILFFAHDKNLYNDVEYILSFANIAVVFVDLGFKPYYFYGYKNTSNKDEFVSFSRNYYLLLFSSYVIIAYLIISSTFLLNLNTILIACILHRILFLSYGWFFLDHFRLKDKAIKIFSITLPVNIASIIIFIILYKLFDFQNVLALFLVQIVFNSIILISNINLFRTLSFKKLFQHIKVTFSYSWPIVINILLITIVNNYVKIYAYNHFSEEAMTNLSIELRISLIIQLTHSSAVSYLSKNIYTDTNNGINKKIMVLYSLMILAATILLFMIIGANVFFEISSALSFNKTIFVIILSTIFWCYIAFLGTYLSKENKNLVKLIFSIVGFFLYAFFLYAIPPTNSLTLTLYMFFALSFILLANVIYLKRYFSKTST